MVGFFYLVEVDFDFKNAFYLTKRFFDLDKEEKLKISIKNNK